ncbi:MAG: type II secretion system protein [Bacilli bacterium]|nr:type II secretion system protein [Bacilli bacterium]
MNKKGFTLIELLAVITILALLAGIAIPNVMTSMNNTRKNSFLLDSKRMIAKAEYLLAINKADREKVKSQGVTYNFMELNVDGEFDKDSDGGDFQNGFVHIAYFNNEYQYCICIVGSKRKIMGQDNTTDVCNIPNTITSLDNLKQYCAMSSELNVSIISDNSGN